MSDLLIVVPLPSLYSSVRQWDLLHTYTHGQPLRVGHTFAHMLTFFFLLNTMLQALYESTL